MMVDVVRSAKRIARFLEQLGRRVLGDGFRNVADRVNPPVGRAVFVPVRADRPSRR